MNYISPRLRQSVWYALWNTTRIIRYCDVLQDKYMFWGKVIKLAIIIPALGSVVSVVESSPDTIQIILSVFVGIVAAYSAFANYEKKAAVFFNVRSQCQEIRDEYHSLWLDIEEYKKSNDEIKEKSDELTRRLSGVIARGDNHEIKKEDKINEQCAKEASVIVTHQYGGSPSAFAKNGGKLHESES